MSTHITIDGDYQSIIFALDWCEINCNDKFTMSAEIPHTNFYVSIAGEGMVTYIKAIKKIYSSEARVMRGTFYFGGEEDAMGFKLRFE